MTHNNITMDLTAQREQLEKLGYSDTDIESICQDIWNTVTSLKIQLEELTDYDASTISKLCDIKTNTYIDNMGCKDLPYGMIKTLNFMNAAVKEVYGDDITGWLALSEQERLDLGWRVGYNTRQYNLFLDVGCYTLNDKRQCGLIVYGSERTDKEWRNARREDGSWLCSEEVKYIDEQDVLAGFRNNKDWNTIAARAVKKDVDKNASVI